MLLELCKDCPDPVSSQRGRRRSRRTWWCRGCWAMLIVSRSALCRLIYGTGGVWPPSLGWFWGAEGLSLGEEAEGWGRHSQRVAEPVDSNTTVTLSSPSVGFRVNISWCECLIRHLTFSLPPNLLCLLQLWANTALSRREAWFLLFVKCTAGPWFQPLSLGLTGTITTSEILEFCNGCFYKVSSSCVWILFFYFLFYFFYF